MVVPAVDIDREVSMVLVKFDNPLDSNYAIEAINSVIRGIMGNSINDIRSIGDVAQPLRTYPTFRRTFGLSVTEPSTAPHQDDEGKDPVVTKATLLTMDPEVSSWSFMKETDSYSIDRALVTKFLVSTEIDNNTVQMKTRINDNEDFVSGPKVATFMEWMAKLNQMTNPPSPTSINMSGMPLIIEAEVTTIENKMPVKNMTLLRITMKTIVLLESLMNANPNLDDEVISVLDYTDDLKIVFMLAPSSYLRVFGKGSIQYIGNPLSIKRLFGVLRELLQIATSARHGFLHTSGRPFAETGPYTESAFSRETQ